MEEIRSSFYAIAVISVSVGIIDVFSESGKLKKYTKYIVSLVVVASLLMPLKSILDFLPDVFDYKLKSEMQENESVDNSSMKETILFGIKKNISDNFSIPDSSFVADIEFENNGNESVITKIDITITDKKYFHLCEKITLFLSGSFACEVSVVQNFGD